MTRYRQDAETGELVEIVEQNRSHVHFINGSFESVVSPVTGERIATRKQMREHELSTGLSTDRDSLLSKRDPVQRETKHERKLAIKDAMERAESSGFHRHVRYDGDKL